MQQHYYFYPFGIDGTVTEIANATDPSGYVSYQQGYTFDYQRNLLSDPLAKSPTYVNFNAIINDITVNIQDYQHYGTPEFIDTSDAGGSPFSYRINAMVRYSSGGTAPFGLYLNILDNNTNTPGTTGWLDIEAAISAARIRLAGNLALYVATTGSDSANTGLSSGSPFATLQHAVNVIYNQYDMNGFTATIHVAAGTYTAGVMVSDQPLGSSQGNPTITFQGASSATTIISVTNSNCFQAQYGSVIAVSGFTLEATGSGSLNLGSAVYATNSGSISVGTDIDFGACDNAHLYASTGAAISIGSGVNYTITGSATVHAYGAFNGSVTLAGASALMNASTNYSGAFAVASFSGNVNGPGWSSSGSGTITGVRYEASLNGVINTNGGGASFFPGNSGGTTATGGQYA